MGFLRTLLFILLGYYLLSWLSKLLRPWLRKYAARKADAYFQRAFDHRGARQEAQRPVGEVTVEKRPARNQNAKQPVGEYIEFEEIE